MLKITYCDIYNKQHILPKMEHFLVNVTLNKNNLSLFQYN